MDQLVVILRPPCEWCGGLFQSKTATVEVQTGIGGATARLCDDCAELIGTGSGIPLIEAADAADLIDAADAATYLAGQTWTFAKTMPRDPHEYLLLRKSTGPMTHLRVARLIRETGEARRFKTTGVYRYRDFGGLVYWQGPGTILNRRLP